MGRLMGPDIVEPAAVDAAGSVHELDAALGARVQRTFDAAPAEPPLTATAIVTAIEQAFLRAQRPAATPEPPIEPEGWTPFQVAALRAGLSALAVGSLTFFATWTRTDDVKLLIIATGTAVVTTLASRFALEGTYDAARFERTRQ